MVIFYKKRAFLLLIEEKSVILHIKQIERQNNTTQLWHKQSTFSLPVE